MKSVFSLGTDEIKRFVFSCSENEISRLLAKLVVSFPLLKEPLNSILSSKELTSSDCSGYNVSELLETVVKACEPYLQPHKERIKFSYPPEVPIDDKNNPFTIIKMGKDKYLYIYPLCRFYQSVKMWLIMSALYSESMFNPDSMNYVSATGNNSFQKSIKGLKNKWKKRAQNNKSNNSTALLTELLYNIPLDSGYEIMVVNGLLSSEFNADGSIKTTNTVRNCEKAKDRLPKIIAPTFTWDLQSEVNYNSSNLDFKLVTQYLIERVKNINLSYYGDKIDVFAHDMEDLLPKLNEEFPKSILDSMAVYPLLHFRLQVLESLHYANNKDNKFLSNRDWIDICEDIKYQTLVYFPLIDVLFHVLLRIKYKNRTYLSELSKALKNIYESDTYHSNNIFLNYRNQVPIVEEVLDIKLSGGSQFSVVYKNVSYRSDQLISTKILHPVYIVNTNGSFAECIKTSFVEGDYEIIRDIPEEVFADFIKMLFDFRKGFTDVIVLSDGSTGLDPNYCKDIEYCRDFAFRGYETTIKNDSIGSFKVFVSNLVYFFKQNKYIYLFEYNSDNEFKSYNQIRREKELYGITLDELESEFNSIKNKLNDVMDQYTVSRLQDYKDTDECKGAYGVGINIKKSRSAASKFNEYVKDAQSLIDRNRQFAFKICAFLNNVLKLKKPENKAYLSQVISDYNYDNSNVITKFKDCISKLCKNYDGLPNNDEYANQRKDNKDFNEVREETANELDSYREEVFEFFEENYKEHVNSLKDLNHEFYSIIRTHMNFDIAELDKGEQQFNSELDKLFEGINHDKIDELWKYAEIFNTYDMKKLKKSIENFNHYSLYFPNYYDCKSAVSSLLSTEENVEDYRDYNNYRKLTDQLK